MQTAVYGLNYSFDENTVTWNTVPATGGLLGTFVTASTAAAWVEIDVSNFVKAAVAAGKTKVSFSLQGTASSTAFVNVASREGGNGAQLVIA